MSIKQIAEFLSNKGYSHGTIASYANQWDCSFKQAMMKLYEKESGKEN